MMAFVFGEVAAGFLGEAEVDDARLVVRIEEDVRRLQIAVDDLAIVGGLHGEGELADEIGGGTRWKPRLLPLLFFAPPSEGGVGGGLFRLTLPCASS